MEGVEKSTISISVLALSYHFFCLMQEERWEATWRSGGELGVHGQQRVGGAGVRKQRRVAGSG